MSRQPTKSNNPKHPKATVSAQPTATSRDSPSKLQSKAHAPIETLIGETPYLLSIHSKYPYRLGESQADNWRTGHHWREGCPFNPDEERLQYMTHLTREWEDSILTVQGAWEEGDDKHSGKARSDISTPRPSSGTGKKLTLSDYKMMRSKSAASSGAEDHPVTRRDERSTDAKKHPTKLAEAAPKLINSQYPVKRGEKR